MLDIAYHPSNTRLATSSDDRTVKFWARRFAAGAAAALAVGGGQTEAAMPDEDELVNAKRRRLTEARRRERLEELDAEQRLARQRRKEKALKRRIAEKQHAADAGADVEEFSSDDSDDSLLTEEDLMHIEKCVVEDEDNEVEVQFLAADPQKWVLACTLTGHKAAVTCVAFTASGDRCFSGSEDGTIRGWTAHIDAADEAAEVDLEELPEELRAGAARRRAERAGRREAGFGAQCVGPCANTCLVLIDVRGGMVRQLSVTCDDAMLFAASEGLGGWGDASAGGLVTVWDLRGYHRAGTFETFHPAVSIACAGEAPYMVTAGDRDGYVYLFRYGCQQPRVPRDARQVPPPNRPTGLCIALFRGLVHSLRGQGRIRRRLLLSPPPLHGHGIKLARRRGADLPRRERRPARDARHHEPPQRTAVADIRAPPACRHLPAARGAADGGGPLLRNDAVEPRRDTCCGPCARPHARRRQVQTFTR